MFTGIVTDVGTVRSAADRGGLRLTIGTAYNLEEVEMGASISCSGVCLTVVDKAEDWFSVDLSAETISKTAADRWRAGAALNLERALRLGDELGGHLVTGHVDAVGNVLGTCPDGASTRVGIAVPKALAAMIAAKGSITVDGVSLTINDVSDVDDVSTHFSVNIIPHTASVTTLGKLHPGAQVNVEADVLARYLTRMMDVRSH